MKTVDWSLLAAAIGHYCPEAGMEKRPLCHCEYTLLARTECSTEISGRVHGTMASFHY